jgi:hypothetical protein
MSTVYLSEIKKKKKIFEKNIVEKIKTPILCLATIFCNLVVYEMWKNIVEPDRPQMTIWRTRNACWITEATDAQSKYVITLPFARQQWLRERAPMLRLYLLCSPILY